MTRFFDQGRDLDKPLVQIPESAPRLQKIALRLFSGYLWFLFLLGAVAILLWVLLLPGLL